MYQSQFIEMFGSRDTTPVGNYIEDSYPGEWGTEDKDGDGVKVIRTTNFTNTGKLDLADVVTRSIIEKKIERKTIHKYDTILERSGGTTDNPVGRVVLFEEDDVYLCNNFTQVLRFKNIDPRFAFYSLFYFYQTNKTAIRAMGNKTTGIQNLNMSKYLEIGIPNASEDEQHKFVLIAQQADKSKFSGLKSQFIEMFGCKTPNAKVGDVSSIVSGKSISKDLEDIPGDIAYVKVADFNLPENNKYIQVSSRYVTSENANSSKLIPPGTIIFAKNGAASMSNKKRLTAIECCIDMNTLAIIPNSQKVDSGFLYAIFDSLDLSFYVRQGAVPSISPHAIEGIEIYLPSFDEQLSFSKICKQADKSKQIAFSRAS